MYCGVSTEFQCSSYLKVPVEVKGLYFGVTLGVHMQVVPQLQSHEFDREFNNIHFVLSVFLVVKCKEHNVDSSSLVILLHLPQILVLKKKKSKHWPQIFFFPLFIYIHLNVMCC